MSLMSTRNKILLFIYRVFIAPWAILLVITLGSLIVPKIRSGLRLRRLRRRWPKFETRPIWIHASSGEFEYAKPFIRELKARSPEIPIVVTYFSPSYAKFIADFPGVDYSLPLPLDLPAPCQQFFSRIRPQVGFIARTDLWPELLAQARSFHVPLILFSALKAKPSPFYLKWFYQWLWSYLTAIFCVGASDEKNILATDPTAKTLVVGDSRFDQVRYRLLNPKATREELCPKDRLTTLVAGSTWPEDERVLLNALAKLLRENRIKLVIAPHEPSQNHLDHLIAELKKEQIQVELYSQASSFLSGVLIIDQVGILAEMYRWGALAFVGGSFKRSVHSVMEPLAAGCLTLVGPFYQNNREAIDFMNLNTESFSFVEKCLSADDLKLVVEKWLQRPEITIYDEIRRAVDERTGASAKLADLLELRKSSLIIPSSELSDPRSTSPSS